MTIEYEKIEKLVLLFWDTAENFHLEKTQQKLGKVFGKIFLINSLQSFKDALELYPKDQEFLCFVHLSHSQSNKGYDDFINSKILRDFPDLRFWLFTSAFKHEVYNDKRESLDVFNYDGYQSKIFKTFIPQSKAEIEGLTEKTKAKTKQVQPELLQADFVIITALEESEMEHILPILEISGKLKNRKHLIEYGTLKNNQAVRIAFASQLSTGMVDAAILTTELISTFSPKVVIMAGVLGGKPEDVEIGDIVVATKVLTIDKGKLTEAGFKSESEGSATDGAYVTGIKRKKKDIIQYISTSDQTRTKAPQIHFGPIACVRYVVDKEGFFNTALEPVDRKTIALEMESYGVARACELSEISPAVLIIKAAMDNTRDKVDDAKHYAAWTSAKVVQYILENGII